MTQVLALVEEEVVVVMEEWVTLFMLDEAELQKAHPTPGVGVA
jgi:hypothetical protein